MLAYLLSKPVDWIVQPKDLQQEGCGRDKVYRILKELEEHHYLAREFIREKGVVKGIEYIVHEEPFPENPDTAEPDTANTDITKYRGIPQSIEGTKEIQSSPVGGSPQPAPDKAAVAATQKALHFGVYPRAIKPCKMLMGTIEQVDSQRRNNGDWYEYRFEDKPFTVQEITALGLWLDSELEDVNLTRAETIADWAGRFRESADYKLYMTRADYLNQPATTSPQPQDNVAVSETNPETKEYVQRRLAELVRMKHA